MGFVKSFCELNSRMASNFPRNSIANKSRPVIFRITISLYSYFLRRDILSLWFLSVHHLTDWSFFFFFPLHAQKVDNIYYETEYRREWCSSMGKPSYCFLFARKFTRAAALRLLDTVRRFPMLQLLFLPFLLFHLRFMLCNLPPNQRVHAILPVKEGEPIIWNFFADFDSARNCPSELTEDLHVFAGCAGVQMTPS